MGGETHGRELCSHRSPGPSPRGRGNLHARGDQECGVGSIPAWAGKPGPTARALAGTRVHPRVGGETFTPEAIKNAESGPSPRGRGNLDRRQGPSLVRGSIPAWAGKPIFARCLGARTAVHPRVGGETILGVRQNRLAAGPSPRGRGNRVGIMCALPRLGSIPAWAGKPTTGPKTPRSGRVHPRVGGETASGSCALCRV